MPTLVVKAGPEPGKRFPLQGELEVGRERAAAIRLDDRTISRRHAQVRVRDGAVTVVDLGSQNGTAVNGMKVKAETPLKDGDEVRFGQVLLTYLEERPAAPAPLEISSVVLEDRPQEVLSELPAADLASSLLSGAGGLSLETVKQRLTVLQDVSVALHRAKDEETLCGLILDRLLELFPGADRGFVLLHDAERDQLRPAAVRVRPGLPGAIAISRTLVWDVLKTQRGVLSGDALEDRRFRRVDTVLSIGIRSVVCVPLVTDGQALGVIALDSLRASGRFVTDDMALLGAIAAQAALALSVKRLHGMLLGRELLERDLALARRIQTRFLPRRFPEAKGWDFRARYEPAQEIGGDYYDFLDLPSRRVGVAVGDVSGKGISAALYMVHLRTAVRAQAAGGDDPAEILRRVNRALVPDLDEGMFVTCTLVLIDPAAGLLRVSSAGHPPPLVRRTDGSVDELAIPRAAPIGVNEGAVYATREYPIRPGETVVLFTDGISEATDAAGELFGTQRLANAMAAAEGSPESVESAVLTSVASFVADAPAADDATLLCFGPRG